MKRVLLIDSSLTESNIITELLTDEGIGVKVAETGNKAIDIARTLKPDLVFLDLALPDVSGYELCERLRNAEETSRTMIVVFSMKDGVDDIAKAFQKGADDYIIKPLSPEFLLKKIKLYLGLR